MNAASVFATSLGIAIYRGALVPLIARYHVWKVSPRVQIARRNWRGVYVPDLGLMRIERAVWLSVGGTLVLGSAAGWTVMTSPG